MVLRPILILHLVLLLHPMFNFVIPITYENLPVSIYISKRKFNHRDVHPCNTWYVVLPQCKQQRNGGELRWPDYKVFYTTMNEWKR
jgi:hypothetical protein